ncbi:hypothetical protein LCGC14_2457610 [marine sediment metagenome]|uniref:Uncharacterized protein n=1 Tax=marine sediment metagenome TaxID=412755 RepID=A0A0F9E855_9ZZZZ
MDIRFGKSAVLPLPILLAGQGVAPISTASLADAYTALAQDLLATIGAVNNLISLANEQTDEGYFRKLTVTEELTIPVQE